MLIPHLLDWTDDPESRAMCESQCSMKAGNKCERPVDLSDHVCPMTSERQTTSKGNGNSGKVDVFGSSIFQFHQVKMWKFVYRIHLPTLDLQIVLTISDQSKIDFVNSDLWRPFRTKSALMNRFHWFRDKFENQTTKPPNHQVKAASCWLQFWFEGVIFMRISG